MSFYNDEEFMSDSHIFLILSAVFIGPVGYALYYLLKFIIYTIQKCDSLIEYIAKKANKIKLRKLMYSRWSMLGSKNKTKYLIIGYKKELHNYYGSWIPYPDKYKKSVVFLERNGLLSSVDISNVELDKN